MEPYFEREELILATKEFIENDPIPNALAVTLTFKQVTLIDSEAKKCVRHFMNRLNYKVYGKRFQRHGKKLSILPVFEGNRNVRLHVHLSLEQPESLSFDKYSKLIHESWGKTNFGHRNIDIQPQYDGWIGYLLKHKSKSDGVLSSIDWENYHPPTSSPE